MTTATTKTLTDGQQGVIHSYNVEITHNRNLLADINARYLNDADYTTEDFVCWSHYYENKIAELEAARAETLATFTS